jgi:hypothetical protein
MGLFDQSRIWVTTEEMFALYNAIHEISGDPAIGLKLGSEERPEHSQSNRHRRALYPLVSRRPEPNRALQTVDVSARDPNRGAGQGMRS